MAPQAARDRLVRRAALVVMQAHWDLPPVAADKALVAMVAPAQRAELAAPVALAVMVVAEPVERFSSSAPMSVARARRSTHLVAAAAAAAAALSSAPTRPAVLVAR